ncbi:hypothetical protein BS50DRAFT_480015 [Corynespora cassiicola Philippines]|uniref:Blue (type 1) copper domain-containing protein n=1 Tax=Corynespora cassiicola Philippines TaxID=1448308 RepID=A0A2T2PBL7_CORCC|nr:hypothetical protein BS50DRAFT_480015 [Corynespora cassiicola Philippines]
MVNTHVIDVGGPNGSLVFTPANVKAAPGDLIQFQFHPKNHSVVQSTFDQPCVPIQNVMTNKTDAFFSGFMPSNASLGAKSQLLTYTIRVMDEKPVWFYCSQGQHCQAGMVGAINAPETGNKTVEAFTNLARAATENLSPGQVAGQGNASPGGSASPSGEAAPGGGSGGSGAGGAGGAGASPTSPSPAQQSTSAASGRLFDACRQTLLTLGMGTMVAFLVL